MSNHGHRITTETECLHTVHEVVIHLTKSFNIPLPCNEIFFKPYNNRVNTKSCMSYKRIDNLHFITSKVFTIHPPENIVKY